MTCSVKLHLVLESKKYSKYNWHVIRLVPAEEKAFSLKISVCFSLEYQSK